MKKTLLAVTSALVLAGAMSPSAFAQSAYYGYGGDNGYGADDGYSDRDGVDHRYNRDDRYADSRDSQRDLGLDYDHDGLPDVYDEDDDNDGLPDRIDPNDHDDRDGRAYLQGRRYEDRGERDHDERYDRYARPGRYGDDGHDNGRHNGRYMAQRRYHAGRYQAPRGYAYRQYQVGSRLPMGYYGSNYYVNSRPYDLSTPPRGYRWNRVGSDAYLVDSNNGIIRDVLYSLFY